MTELYIEGQRMDMGPGTIIARTFQQNLLSSQGSVDSPYTNSFALPWTKNNARVLGNPEEPTSLTPAPYVKLDALIKQHGIEQFPNSIAEVQGFDGTNYNVQVFAGAVPFFDLLGERKLNHLDFSAYNHVWDYENVVAGVEGVEGVYIYELIDRGKPLNLARVHPADFMPSVYAKAIWDKIFSELGIGYQMEEHADFNALTVPFSNEKPVHTGQLLFNEAGEVVGQGWAWARTVFTGIIPQSAYAINLPVLDYGVLRVKFKIDVIKVPTSMNGKLYAELKRNGVVIDYREFIISAPGIYEMDEAFDIEYGEDLSKLVISSGHVNFGGILGPGPDSGQFAYATRTVTYDEDAFFGTEWDLSINLPDMKQRDFILAMCNLFGWSLVYEPYSGTIQVKPMEKVPQNTALAPDWTGKIDYSTRPRVAYRLPDTARRNLYRWKEDETVQEGYGDGVIIASNEHLEEERTAVEMVFAASEEREGLLLIPIHVRKTNNRPGEFSQEKATYPELLAMGDPTDGTRVFVRDATGDPTVIRGWAVYENKANVWIKREREDDYDTQSVEPRLAIRGEDVKTFTVSIGPKSSTFTLPVPIFTPLSFAGRILDRYHEVTQRVLSRVQMLTVNVLLTAQDFAVLDSTVPVWVDQFQDYYYLNKVTDYTSEAVPCEAELIKLN